MNYRETRTQRHEKKYGIIPPSTPETVRACNEYMENMNANISRRARQAANLERHANDKNRRHSVIVSDTNAKHAQETGRRHARQLAKVRDPDRFNGAALLAFVFIIILVMTACPRLAGV